MKHTFTLIYELDTTVACAVAAYLDAEHYVYLHQKYSPVYEVIERSGRRTKVRQEWNLGKLTASQTYWAEYDPPARFINYEITSEPWWLPTIHHLVKTRTELRYYPTEDGKRTVSHLTVNLEMPAWLYPLRHVIQEKLCQLKREKDEEDMQMIRRRDQVFGRGDIRGYLADHQFMLHKEDFVKHFGGEMANVAEAAE